MKVKLTSFQSISAPGAHGTAVGEYSGHVSFLGTDGCWSVIIIDKMLWSGEDISMELKLGSE
ncbi:MAG: hypothetical protein M3Q07_05770 [Pseudobdellovibrionaceae bacterium]|nr:hypothetical protein [Pseudobdellovibrionaceae bacterium]